jgi:hypothetical protein
VLPFLRNSEETTWARPLSQSSSGTPPKMASPASTRMTSSPAVAIAVSTSGGRTTAPNSGRKPGRAHGKKRSRPSGIW